MSFNKLDDLYDNLQNIINDSQSDATTSNTKFYVTCLWEWDMSSIG